MFNIFRDIFRGMDAKSLMVGWLRLGLMFTTSNEVFEGVQAEIWDLLGKTSPCSLYTGCVMCKSLCVIVFENA